MFFRQRWAFWVLSFPVAQPSPSRQEVSADSPYNGNVLHNDSIRSAIRTSPCQSDSLELDRRPLCLKLPVRWCA